MSFISYLKDGISLGSIYAIIALGYTMVYGIAKMLNFRTWRRYHGWSICNPDSSHQSQYVTNFGNHPFRSDLYRSRCCN